MSCLLAAQLSAEESEHHRTPPPDEDDGVLDVPEGRPQHRATWLTLCRRPRPELRHLLHSPPLHRSYGLDGRSPRWQRSSLHH